MRIAIIGAMQVEIEVIKKSMSVIDSAMISQIDFVRGEWCGHEIIVAVSGVGKVNAALCTQAMIMQYRPDILINTGVAGGVGDNVELLDVVIADKVVQHDVDTTALGDPMGMVSGIKLIEIPCQCQAILKMLKLIDDERILFGTIASGDQFIADEQKNKNIGEQFHAKAIDMESGSIGQVCYVNQIPCCIIRTISDSGNSIEYEEFVLKAAIKSVDILKKILTSLV